MKLLLISNSTNAGEEYLRYPMPEIGRFLQGVSEIVFVPYAAVTFSYAEYEKRCRHASRSWVSACVRYTGPKTPRAWYARRKPCASGAATPSRWQKDAGAGAYGCHPA